MEKELNEEEALKEMQSIESTKKPFKENGLVFFVLAYLVFITCIVNFLLIRFSVKNSLYFTWIVLLFASIALPTYNWLKGYYKGPINYPVKTSPALFNIWMYSSYILCGIIMPDPELRGKIAPFAVIIGLLGVPAFITGWMLKFKPLLIGGAITIFALPFVSACSYIKPCPEYQLLVLAASVLVAFIIPGHLLRASK